MIDYTLYMYLAFMAIIFFIYGLLLSEIIDYIFPTHDEINGDFRLALEIIGEMGVAYLIYFSFQHYLDKIIISLLYKISKSIPIYLNQLLLTAFSFGIFRHLQKSANKILYFRKKFANPILKKIPFMNFFIIK